MSDCELISVCIFFNDRMTNMPSVSDLYKKKFCRDEHSRCARYTVYKKLGVSAVPQDLFPNDMSAALAVINDADSL